MICPSDRVRRPTKPKCVGVTQSTASGWLAGKRLPMPTTLAKLRTFLNAEAKRNVAGDGIKPIEPVRLRIARPVQQLRYARLCPFCRKARGKIQLTGRKQFQGVCPKCEATGPKRGSEQVARRAWNGMGENRTMAAKTH